MGVIYDMNGNIISQEDAQPDYGQQLEELIQANTQMQMALEVAHTIILCMLIDRDNNTSLPNICLDEDLIKIAVNGSREFMMEKIPEGLLVKLIEKEVEPSEEPQTEADPLL